VKREHSRPHNTRRDGPNIKLHVCFACVSFRPRVFDLEDGVGLEVGVCVVVPTANVRIFQHRSLHINPTPKIEAVEDLEEMYSSRHVGRSRTRLKRVGLQTKLVPPIGKGRGVNDHVALPLVVALLQDSAAISHVKRWVQRR